MSQKHGFLYEYRSDSASLEAKHDNGGEPCTYESKKSAGTHMSAVGMEGGWEMRVPTNSEVRIWVNTMLLFAVKEKICEITVGPDVVPAYADVRFIYPDGERRHGPGLGRGQLEPTIVFLMRMAELSEDETPRKIGRFTVKALGAVHKFQLEVEAVNNEDRRVRIKAVS